MFTILYGKKNKNKLTATPNFVLSIKDLHFPLYLIV